MVDKIKIGNVVDLSYYDKKLKKLAEAKPFDRNKYELLLERKLRKQIDLFFGQKE